MTSTFYQKSTVRWPWFFPENPKHFQTPGFFQRAVIGRRMYATGWFWKNFASYLIFIKKNLCLSLVCSQIRKITLKKMASQKIKNRNKNARFVRGGVTSVSPPYFNHEYITQYVMNFLVCWVDCREHLKSLISFRNFCYFSTNSTNATNLSICIVSWMN